MVLSTGMFLLFICLEVENNEDSQRLYLLHDCPGYHGKSLISADNRNVLDPGAVEIQGQMWSLIVGYVCLEPSLWSILFSLATELLRKANCS